MALNRLVGSSCSPVFLKTILCLLALCLGGYIIGPPLYWHLMEGLSAVGRPTSSTSASCSPCNCDCSSEPIMTIPLELINSSFTGCAKRDPEVTEDSESNFSELLSEELKIREAEAMENQQRADKALLEAKKVTSQYQKEADKCNSGMETCEEARERSVENLNSQKKLTAIWEIRARQKGWKDGNNAKSKLT